MGGDGDDVLKGGAGADDHAGGAHNDTYYLDNIADSVTELAGNGTDTVITEMAYTLSPGASIEFLHTMVAAAVTEIDLTGNEFAQSITGNAGVRFRFEVSTFGGADSFRPMAGAVFHF